VLSRLATADAIVYGVGSLWSSICPSLVPAGVGEAVAARDCAKVLMLNGTRDRETTGMGVMDICRAVASSLNRQHSKAASRVAKPLANPLSAYVTAVLAPDGCEFDLGDAELLRSGIRVIRVPSENDEQGRVVFQPRPLVAELRSFIAAHRAWRAQKQGYII
jgi:cathepsin L